MEEEKEVKETEMPINEKVKEEVDKSIKKSIEQGVQVSNVDYLTKMINIKKDIAKIEKEENEMRYRAYGEYSDGEYGEGGSYGRRSRDSRGRYTEGSYGRRGVKGTGRGRYRGEEMMDEMNYHYGNYSESREQYGAEHETLKSLDYMLKSVVEFVEMLESDASSQEEINLIKKYTRKIAEM